MWLHLTLIKSHTEEVEIAVFDIETNPLAGQMVVVKLIIRALNIGIDHTQIPGYPQENL